MPTEENWGMHQSSLYSRENQEKKKKIKMESHESCVAIPKGSHKCSKVKTCDGRTICKK
jgi:hypothetical protein